jgi:hypothetical protein
VCLIVCVFVYVRVGARVRVGRQTYGSDRETDLCYRQTDRQTDQRTDGRTDRQTVSSQTHPYAQLTAAVSRDLLVVGKPRVVAAAPRAREGGRQGGDGREDGHKARSGARGLAHLEVG